MNERYGHAWVTFCGKPIPSFSVAVPLYAREQERGLQGFRLKAGEGMMFPSRRWPDEEKIPMHMASVDVPLHMIWITRDGVVSRIEANVPPGNRQTFSESALCCIEIASSDPSVSFLDVGDFAVIEPARSI